MSSQATSALILDVRRLIHGKQEVLSSAHEMESFSLQLRKGADKSLAFPIFLFAAQPKEFFLDGLKKLEQ
jgi:hypothetical protein